MAAWPGWASPVALACLAAGAFLYFRYRPRPLRGQAFGLLLRRLALESAVLALSCLGLHLLARSAAAVWPATGTAAFAVAHALNAGTFLLLLARLTYAWQALIYFKSRPALRWQWELLEILLGVVALVQLLGLPFSAGVGRLLAVGLGIFGIFVSSNQRWVAYLTQSQKWQAIGYQAIILATMLIYWQYFRALGGLVPPPQVAFLLLVAFLAAFYASMGVLVTIFSLPTTGVFEQRRSEIMSLQRLTQIIQRGQTAHEIYQTLLDSAVQTVRADAAGLLPPAAAADDAAILPPPTFNLAPGQLADLKRYLCEHVPEAPGLLLHDLAAVPQWPLGLPYRSLAVVPLRGAKHDYGTLVVLRTEPQGFDPDDVSVLQTFTSQTVLSIENLQLVADSLANQRTQEELKIASQVQDSLIPKKLPTDDWFDISSHSLAAKEVGGDFYDFLHLPGRRLAVLIGDVSGKGVTAAFHMAQMKGIFHALMQENPLAKNARDKFPVPSRFMIQANQALTHCLERSSFITSSLYIIDYEQGGFMFARAGHCHTLYYHAVREEVFYFESTGLGLGIVRNESYEKHISNQFYDYGPGDVMVVYTDGIVEARGGDGTEEYGEDRLKLRLEESYYLEADDIKSFMLADLNTFTAGLPIHDDQTLLVIKFKAVQPPAAT